MQQKAADERVLLPAAVFTCRRERQLCRMAGNTVRSYKLWHASPRSGEAGCKAQTAVLRLPICNALMTQTLLPGVWLARDCTVSVGCRLSEVGCSAALCVEWRMTHQLCWLRAISTAQLLQTQSDSGRVSDVS